MDDLENSIDSARDLEDAAIRREDGRDDARQTRREYARNLTQRERDECYHEARMLGS